MTKAIALAYAKDGIRVNCILPGTIESPMAKGMLQEGINDNTDDELREGLMARHPLGRFGTAQEVAQVFFIWPLRHPVLSQGLI